MAAFASPEWIEALGTAAARATADPDVALTIEQRITGESPATWHLVFADGSVRAVAGAAADPTIVLKSSRETATAIHGGTLSAQRAFLDGALQIGGDLNALITQRAVLSEVAALMAAAI